MFKGMRDMGSLLKQAKEMKDKMSEIQKKLKSMTFTASDNGITIEVNGDMEIINIKIDPNADITKNHDKLAKAIQKAGNQAIKQSKDKAASELSSVTGGLNIPGL